MKEVWLLGGGGGICPKYPILDPPLTYQVNPVLPTVELLDASRGPAQKNAITIHDMSTILIVSVN